MDAERVETWLTQGRLDFPEVALSDAAFREAAAGATECTEGADLFLAIACARGDAAAVRRFERDHLGRIAGWLKLSGSEREIADEVRQRVAARVLVGVDGEPPRIAQYRGRGPLWAWVRIVALREHARLRREHGRETPAADPAAALDHLARSAELSPDLIALGRHRDALLAAFRAAVAELAAPERTLLRLAYVDALPLEAIGTLLAVNKSTVSRRLAAIRTDILARATARLRAELAIPTADLESLLAVMPRDLDVSLGGLLRTSA